MHLRCGVLRKTGASGGYERAVSPYAPPVRDAAQGQGERRRRHLAGVSWETWRSLGALGLPARACGVGVLRKTGENKENRERHDS